MSTELDRLIGVSRHLASFVVERYPFALSDVIAALQVVAPDGIGGTGAQIDASRAEFRQELARRLKSRALPPDLPETTPRTAAAARMGEAADELVDACDGFLRRAAIEHSLTREERIEILRGMILTRATDNKLKALFIGGDVRYESTPFQGKGFRSLGQEAIYAAAIRLRRGAEWQLADGSWSGDVVAPLIRDLGAALAMRCEPATVRMALNAQMAKAGPPMEGKDLNIGDLARGILPPTAPLGIATLTIAGMALAFQREGSGRVAISFIGDGGSSLGEWHEAVNLCAVRRLPAIFCVQNNQTALSTPIGDQTAVRVFADKAAGYGIPGITLDGTDPDAIAAAFAWAAERARGGQGPTLIELVSMRMCGHAHHDDMLYLGRDPHPSWDYPAPTEQGYVDRELYAYWAARDPIATYAARLEAESIVSAADVARFRSEAEAIVQAEAQAIVDAPWPERWTAGQGVFAGEAPRVHVEVLDPEVRLKADTTIDVPRRSGTAVRSQGEDVSRGRHARRRRCASRGPARVRLRSGRRRQVRQCVPAPAAAAD